MSIFKRGPTYWFHFLHDGQHVQRSTKQGNPRVARQMEAAHRTALAKGEVGIMERKVAPMFTDAAKRFIDHVEARHENKPRTILHRAVSAPESNGKRKPIFSPDFVMHSLRHTMLTRLGESGVDAFTIMRIAGHSSIVVSQRYIHPTPEAVERAFERLQLSAKVVAIEPKRQLPATVSATLIGDAAVSC